MKDAVMGAAGSAANALQEQAAKLFGGDNKVFHNVVIT